MIKEKSMLSKIGLGLIRFYQSCISPFIGGRAACRFIPSCSEYTRQSIEKYGFFRGVCMGIKRVSRCRPGGGYGYDPVP